MESNFGHFRSIKARVEDKVPSLSDRRQYHRRLRLICLSGDDG